MLIDHTGHKVEPRKGPVPEGPYSLPLGAARLACQGTDATVVTYGVGVSWAESAARTLADEGWSIEIIDLCTLIPWDVSSVIDSVRKTSKALVLHEAPLTGGFGAEVAATISNRCFADLDAPVERLGGLDTPVPFSKAIEDLYMPKNRLIPTLRRLLTA